MGKYDNYDVAYAYTGIGSNQPQSLEEWGTHKDNERGASKDECRGDVPWGRAHIYYALDKIEYEDPRLVSDRSVTNDNSGGGTKSQTITLTVTKASTKGSHEDSDHTWANEVGGEVGTDESFGIPFIEKTKVQIKTTYDHTDTHSHTWGTERSTTETISIDDAVTAAPGEILKCEAFLTKQKFVVPYKLWKYTKFPSPKPYGTFGAADGKYHESFGIFRGESSYAIHGKFTKMN